MLLFWKCLASLFKPCSLVSPYHGNALQCQNISVEALTSLSGYQHASSIQSLNRSAKTCEVCKFFFSFLANRVCDGRLVLTFVSSSPALELPLSESGLSNLRRLITTAPWPWESLMGASKNAAPSTCIPSLTKLAAREKVMRKRWESATCKEGGRPLRPYPCDNDGWLAV